MPALSTRMPLILLGLFHGLNGLYMLVLPARWYEQVPGVPLTGPFNSHFVMDIGWAFLASGIALGLGSRSGPRMAGFAVAGALFPAFHALMHAAHWLLHGAPSGSELIFSEYVGVGLVAVLGLFFAGLRWRQD